MHSAAAGPQAPPPPPLLSVRYFELFKIRKPTREQPRPTYLGIFQFSILQYNNIIMFAPGKRRKCKLYTSFLVRNLRTKSANKP